MVLIEMALHNIFGLKQLLRIKLKSGLNLIHGVNGSGKTSIHRTLLALLSPSPEKGVLQQGQAGIIARALDRQIYRLVRDFSKQKSSLGLRDAEGRFNALGQNENQIHQFVLENTRGLGIQEIESVFIIQRSMIPSSRLLQNSVLPGSKPSENDLPPDTPKPTVDRERSEARVREIQGILAKADEASNLEDMSAELRSQSNDLRQRIKTVHEKSIALKELENKDKPLDKVWPLLSNQHQLLEQYVEQQAVRFDQIRTLDEDRSRIQAAIDAVPTQPVYLTPLFVSGSGILAVSFILPQFIRIQGVMRELFFLPVVLGLGLMGWAAFRDFQRVGRRKVLNARLENLTSQQEMIDTDFEKGTAPAKELLEKGKCSSVEEFKKRVAEREHLESLNRDIIEERNLALEGKTPEELEKDQEEINTRLKDTEREAQALAGVLTDVYILQEELRQLQEGISETAQQQESAASISSDPAMFNSQTEETHTEYLLPDALRKILQKEPLRSLLTPKLEPLNTAIRHWFAQFPQAKSLRITVNEDFSVTLLSKEGDSLEFQELNSGLLDTAYLVCHIAIAGLVSATHPFPLILDDAIHSLDDTNQKIILDILREIAQNKQVLLLTTRIHPGKEGEGTITLPPPVY